MKQALLGSTGEIHWSSKGAREVARVWGIGAVFKGLAQDVGGVTGRRLFRLADLTAWEASAVTLVVSRWPS